MLASKGSDSCGRRPGVRAGFSCDEEMHAENGNPKFFKQNKYKQEKHVILYYMFLELPCTSLPQ